MRIENATKKINMVGAAVVPMVRLMTRNAQVNKSFQDTELIQAFTVNCDAQGFTLPEGVPEGILVSLIAATSDYLRMMKESSKDVATALIMQGVDGVFKFAAIVKYNVNPENPDEPGSWDYNFTFYEDDIKDLEEEGRVVKKFYNSDDSFRNVFDRVSYDIGGVQFEHDRYMLDASIILIDTVKQILDAEAVAGEEVELEIPGYATFVVGVEDDKKIYTATPDGAMKAIVKGDKALE